MLDQKFTLAEAGTTMSYAEEFICFYLKEIRHMSSMFSSRDWGFFPRYWFHPVKIGIFQSIDDDIAISFGDIAKAKTDIIRKIQCNSRIEESQFPNLDYQKWPFFSIPDGTHHSMIKGGTFSLGDHPIVILGQRVEFKLMNIRVEAVVAGYPRERAFLWFFTSPNKTHLMNRKRAAEEAAHDFWDTIGSIVFTKLDAIVLRNLTPEITELFLDSVDRLQKEYHSLITQEDIEEQRLQNFLENHFFLIDPSRSFTKEKRKLGEYYADFVLKYDDGSLILVEIQRNTDPISENEMPSKGFKEAIEQLHSWFKWISSNEPLLLPKCSGLIIIGRKSNYDKNQKPVKNLLADLIRPTKLVTYDYLENSFEHVRTSICNAAKKTS